MSVVRDDTVELNKLRRGLRRVLYVAAMAVVLVRGTISHKYAYSL